MSFELPEVQWAIKAVDEASAVFENIQSSAQESMGQVEESIEQVDAAQTQMTTNLRGVVTGFAGVATSAFSLYNAYDRIEDMTVSVNRAQLALHTTTASLQDATEAYNEAVEKYGADSEEAAEAAENLSLAQERYEVAVERADMVQGNLNETMVQSAISVIPTAITMIDSLVRIQESWGSTTSFLHTLMDTEAIKEGIVTAAKYAHAAAQWALNAAMNANPIMLVITAIGALVAILVTAYATCEPFRNAVDQTTATLRDYFQPAIDAVSGALSWLWNNVVQPFIDGLRWLSDSLSSVAGWFNSIGSNATTSAGMIDSYTQSMIDLHNTVGEPPSTGLIESFEFLDKTMKEIESPNLDVAPVEIPEVEVPKLGEMTASVGFAVSSLPELPEIEGIGAPITESLVSSRLGAIGSAASPGSSPINITITAPLVNVEGSADRETAKLAASLVKEELRNVVVEASSSGAPGTQKRIRTGGLINVA